MPNLDLVMTGDCISAVTALGNTERAVRSLQSRAGSGVGVAVSVGGARAAQKDLAGVGAALSSTSAAAQGLNRTPIAGGMVAGAAAARGLTSGLSGTNRAMSEARAGAGALAVAGAGATRSMGGMLPVVAGMTSRMGAMGRVAGAVSALPAAIPGGRGGVGTIAAAAAATQRFQSSLAAQQLQAARGLPVMAMANAQTAAMAANATSAAGAMTRLQARDPLNGRFVDPTPGIFGTIRQGWREGVAQARAEAERGGPPPVIPPRGGGGGGGGGGDDAERQGAAAARAGAEVGKGIGTMLMAGLAVGIATNAAYAKHAMDAVNVTISETPGLADKAKEAADELGSGIRDMTEGADLERFSDQFEKLGTANRALGQVQGQIGMQNLSAKLETEARSADVQTRALARMAPAFDAAIRGSANLGDALLEGISNPQVVNGVRAVGEVLAKPEIAKGLSDITTGATGASMVMAKVMGDGAAFASRLVNTVVGGQNVTDMSGALFGGGAAAALAKGAARIPAAALGASAVYGSQSLMERGKDDLVTPSIINMLIASTLAKSIPGKIAMGLAGQYGTEGISEAAKNVLPPAAAEAAPWSLAAGLGGAKIGLMRGGWRGALAGFGAGFAGVSGAAIAASQDPVQQMSGMNQQQLETSKQGLLQEEFAKSHPGQQRPTPAPQQGRTIGEHLFGGGTPAAGEGPVVPGPQQPEKPQTIAESLQQRHAFNQSPAQQARRAHNDAIAAGVPPPATAPAAAATQQLSQSAQQAQQSVQGLGAAMPQVAQQVQQLPAAFAPVQQLPAQANAQMNTAAATISQSAQQVGAAIPPAISTGIVKQTPKVCDAAADMGNSMVNCTGRALQSASPSKKFIALGESTGDGAAIGVNNSAGGAIDAVGSMAGGMLAAVGALGSGVEAASDGAVPIAESGGLMIGYVWARSVATGVDSVLKSADFAQASMPAINSALAKTTLGKLGLLGVAGSGASISKSANGGMISMPAPVINASFQVIVDGAGPMRVISQQVMDAGFGELADSFGRQRG